jgi:hypothetical protein
MDAMGQVATALISGFVALLVGGASALLTVAQIRRERRKWLTDVKVAWSLELHKTRIASYPDALRAIVPLSHAKASPITPETCGTVADELNEWLYSTGGLCADATTRGAVFGLRKCCHKWAKKGGSEPADLYQWRDLTIAFLRRDLDLMGNEDHDFHLGSTLLSKLQEELDSIVDRKSRKRDPYVLDSPMARRRTDPRRQRHSRDQES